MALSPILKQIYLNASDEVIRRGKKIFHTGGVQLVENDPITESATFRVRNDSYYNHYRVKIENYGNGKKLIMRCPCPYNMGTVCKHEAAALFQLNDLIESGYFDEIKIAFDQKDTTVRMRQIAHHFLKLFSSSEIYSEAKRLAGQPDSTRITEAANDTVSAIVTDEKGKSFPVVLKQNEERYFDTSCSCDEKKHPLCVHKVALFLQLYEMGGAHYFSTIRDWDAQKNKLLKLYGYSLKDDLTGKFDFSFHDGKLFMRVLNPSVKKLDFFKKENETAKKETTNEPEKLRYGLVIEEKGKTYPFTTFQLVSGVADSENTKLAHQIVRCAPDKYIPTSSLEEQDQALITALRKLDAADELSRHIKRNAPFGNFLENLEEKLKKPLPEEALRQQIWDFYLPRYQNLFTQFQDFPFIYFLGSGQPFLKKNLLPIRLSDKHFSLQIICRKDNDRNNVLLKREFLIDEETVSNQHLALINNSLIKNGEEIFAAESYDTIKVMEWFSGSDEIEITAGNWPGYLENILLPAINLTRLDLDEQLQVVESSKEPRLQLELKETEKLLILKPVFLYDDQEREWLDKRQVIRARNGILHIQNRDIPAEQTFLNLLRYIHPSIQESRKMHAFVLPAKEALKGDWYYGFMDEMKQAGVTIVGYNDLRQLKINPHKPKTKIHIATGIDWFDTELDLTFGEERVAIADIKKAFARKQNFVSLKDGSIGLLPDEWIQKYSLLIKMGSVNGLNTLRLKKMHFTALENVEEEADGQDFRSQLAERRAGILSYNYEHPREIPVPQNVTATLRPYQHAGIQWMDFLNETGWGGILADDMGLGKTVQALTFLQYYLNNNPEAIYLVVCPTTLIYNWESEIKKFTPDILYKIHHGTARSSSEKELRENSHLIITTYGTLRSDIKMFASIAFDYVVLDESQAIKNPSSQIARSVLLLQSKNRLALSGTPVQNNTFDLFSQMNFLNPGMLGSMEFFRNEFSVPIDKMQEKEARENLKKLIRPFLLRRTKEQVAPDLPEKTETIIYCEMGSHQKKIYHAYRNSFRTKILQEIDEKGVSRSRLSVLTGLMKLRQICDSPAILKEDIPLENSSVKIQELVRELSENTGNHKALVFSQFLGMLALIRTELEKLQIPYVYFDGGTTTKEREKAIQTFQKQEDCRVFLISLKAGGVGLNLTAADYVYIVDPWWNPTVEQQAIDRTHRIGQTKKIFAYRLICKDTIEEKILLLQHRKLNLAKELIADENAFVKKLTKEDIAYLLS